MFTSISLFMPVFEPTTYLNRIGYNGPLKPTAVLLRDLQLAHLYHVPFENLSIHWQQPIILEPHALFEKVVLRRRGGFCYELNGLFALLLEALGFEVTRLSAQVSRREGGFGPPFDHLTLRVTAADGSRWLADVGFGDTFREPLPFELDRADTQFGKRYRLTLSDSFYQLEEEAAGQDWQPQYRFPLSDYPLSDFAEMCRYHQTSPDSHFTQGRVCALALPDGRITLSEGKLTRTPLDGEPQVTRFEEAEIFDALLLKHFGLESNNF